MSREQFTRALALAAALSLSLALAVPALAQDAGVEAGDVQAQGAGEDGGDDGSSDTDEDSGEFSASEGPDQSRASNGVDDVNCEDFDFREEAEDFFEAGNREDEDRLDEDPGEDDGMPCENLPSRSDSEDDSDDGDTPEGGVDSGLGGTAKQSSSASPAPFVWISAAALLTLVLGGLALCWRRD
jgi:hypothetical protein